MRKKAGSATAPSRQAPKIRGSDYVNPAGEGRSQRWLGPTTDTWRIGERRQDITRLDRRPHVVDFVSVWAPPDRSNGNGFLGSLHVIPLSRSDSHVSTEILLVFRGLRCLRAV